MKLLLIQPPLEDFYHTSIRTYPLGLLYLAARVNDLCEVSLLDARTGFKARTAEGEPPSGLEGYFRPDRLTPFSLFRQYRRFGMSSAALAGAIAEEKPDVVAISALFTTYSEEAMDTARVAKELNQDIKTVMGGMHPTLFPEEVLSSPWVDFVIRGEGETPFRGLIERLLHPETGRPGDVCFKDQERLRIAPVNTEQDIDRLPDRSMVGVRRYRIGRKNYAAMLTSRGCPNNCSFCGKPPVPFRKRSISGIAADMDECIGRGIEAVDFQDDMLTGDLRFFKRVLGLFEGRGMTLSAMNGIYSQGLDRDVLDRMYRAGFRRLNFSLVDASDAMLVRQNRAGTDSFIRLLPYLEDSPFLTEVHFIMGLPLQTPAEVMHTILFLMEKRVLLGPSIFYLAPGSVIFQQMALNKRPAVKSWRSSAMFPANHLFPRPISYTLMKLVRFVNYVKGLIDSGDISGRLGECLEIPAKNAVEGHIRRSLLEKKRFLWQDKNTKEFTDEPVEHDMVGLFFRMARGRRIKGFHSGDSVVVDL